MAAILTTASTNGFGSGESRTGPCTVYATGEFGTGEVVIQIATADTAALYVRPDKAIMRESRIRAPGAILISATGAYYIRAGVSGANGSTSITVTTVQ